MLLQRKEAKAQRVTAALALLVSLPIDWCLFGSAVNSPAEPPDEAVGTRSVLQRLKALKEMAGVSCLCSHAD